MSLAAGSRGAVFDVFRDDQRFVMIKGDDADGPPTSLVVVLNWLDVLKRRMATK